MKERVTLWVGPLESVEPPPGVACVSPRHFYAYDRFANALGAAMSCAIEVIERRPEEALGEGLVLMNLDLRLTLTLVERAANGGHAPASMFL